MGVVACDAGVGVVDCDDVCVEGCDDVGVVANDVGVAVKDCVV